VLHSVGLLSRARIRRLVAALTSVALVAGVAEAVTSVPAAAAPAAAPAGDVSEAPDGLSAQAAARRLGHRVEVSGMRSEATTTYAHPDGSFTSEAAPGPVRVRRADGSWAAVDTTLRVAGWCRLRCRSGCRCPRTGPGSW
jgi:hypothetical protein